MFNFLAKIKRENGLFKEKIFLKFNESRCCLNDVGPNVLKRSAQNYVKRLKYLMSYTHLVTDSSQRMGSNCKTYSIS